jgi:hypothetical protein
LQVDVTVDVVGVAISYEGIHKALVGRLAGGTTGAGGGTGLRVTVPPVLVQRNSDAIDVPIFDSFLQLSHNPVATAGTIPWLGFPFQRIKVHPGQAHGATAAGCDDLVAGNFKHGRSG